MTRCTGTVLEAPAGAYNLRDRIEEFDFRRAPTGS